MSTKIEKIQEYINNNVNNLIKLDMLEFFNYIHINYYNELDITFMKYFLSLCGKEHEFCVDQEKLTEFGVLKENAQSNHIKRTLTDYLLLVEDEDYILLSHVGESRLNKHGGSNGNKKTYILTPYALKLALIRSKNTKVYARYYILLEIVFKFYNDYQTMYKDKLLFMKDDKIDHLINQNNNLQQTVETVVDQNNNLINQNNNLENMNLKILNLAEQQGVKIGEMHETVKKLEIKIDELIKLINKFLSGQIDLIYTFQSNIQDTKVLIMYKLQHKEDETKYNLVLRYAGLNQISKSISNFTKKKVNEEYNIVSFTTIGAIQQNMISVQQIYKKLNNIDSLNKQTLDNLSNDDCNKLIKKVFDVIDENKIKKFSENMQSNDILREHNDSMKHLMKLDNKFNKELVTIFDKYLGEKLYSNKSFRVSKLCTELKDLYHNYKQ